MEEIWKDVVGYEGYYKVSNTGKIKSLRRVVEKSANIFVIKKEKELKLSIARGYFFTKLCIDRKNTNISVHRLVAIAFIPNPENKRCVNHKDGNKGNNYLENLEWCTHSENIQHSLSMGLAVSGERSWNARLTKEDVLYIRKIYSRGVYGAQRIGKELNIPTTTIASVIKRQSWNHI